MAFESNLLPVTFQWSNPESSEEIVSVETMCPVIPRIGEMVKFKGTTLLDQPVEHEGRVSDVIWSLGQSVAVTVVMA